MSNYSGFGQALWNKAKTFTHPESFKKQSLLIASLSLVISRMAVANMSAIKARGTPEGYYRYREAIRTDMREVGGFTMGFLVLRQLQSWIDKGFRKVFNIADDSQNGFDYDLKKNLAKAWHGTKVDSFTADYAHSKKFAFNNGQMSAFAKGFSNFFHFEGKSAEALIEKVYKRGPLVLASIPSVLLAGYFLERTTRDHSEQIVDAVSKRLGHKGTNKGMAPPKPPLQSVTPFNHATQFGANRFMVNPYRMTSSLHNTQRL